MKIMRHLKVLTLKFFTLDLTLSIQMGVATHRIKPIMKIKMNKNDLFKSFLKNSNALIC